MPGEGTHLGAGARFHRRATRPLRLCEGRRLLMLRQSSRQKKPAVIRNDLYAPPELCQARDLLDDLLKHDPHVKPQAIDEQDASAVLPRRSPHFVAALSLPHQLLKPPRGCVRPRLVKSLYYLRNQIMIRRRCRGRERVEQRTVA